MSSKNWVIPLECESSLPTAAAAESAKMTRARANVIRDASVIWSGVASITGGYQWSRASAAMTKPLNRSIPPKIPPMTMIVDSPEMTWTIQVIALMVVSSH